MHGDYAEEASDPLSSILKSAGVPGAERPAPNYATGVTDEGVLGTVVGSVAGTALAPEIPGSSIIGGAIGNEVGDTISSDEVDEDDNTTSAQQIASARADMDAQSKAAAQELATAQANAPKGPLFHDTPDAGVQDFRDPANAWRIPGNNSGVKDMGSVVPANANSLPKPSTGGGASGSAMDLPKGMLGGPTTPVNEKESSPLAGKYGHSGKMKEVGKETSFLDRLKELSGMIRN
jgi:hypothetical protein